MVRRLVVLLLLLASPAWAQGTLTIPNTFAGKALGPLGAFDQNFKTIADYVNALQATVSTLSNRPAVVTLGLNTPAVGTSDDTATVQAALTTLQATGGTLMVPCNTTVNISGRLTYTSLLPISVVGCGWSSKFQWTPATDTQAKNKGMLNIFGTGDPDASHVAAVVIRDLFFDFGASRSATYDDNKRGLNLYNADNILVTGVRLKGSRGEMLGLGNFGSASTPGTRAWIIANQLEDFPQVGINPNVFDAAIIGNTIVTGNAPIEAGRSRVSIIGNTIRDMTGLLKIASVAGFVISANKLTDCAATDTGSVLGVIQVAGGGSTTPATDGAITGNTITATSTFNNMFGINLIRGTATSDNARIAISGNTIQGTRQGIQVTSLLDGSITDNVIIGDSGTTGAGILLATTGQTQRTTVSGNTVRNFAARTVTPTSNGPIQDQTVFGTDLNVVGWNTQESALVLGATGRVDFSNNNATPSVAPPAGMYVVANSNPTTITALNGGTFGQVVNLVFSDANTTINNGGNFQLNGTFTSATNATLTLVLQFSTVWQEVSRSDGNAGAVFGAPTGTRKGAGTINLAATTPIYSNGNALFSTGTPTCGTGCATIVTNSMDSWGAMTASAATSVTVNWSHTLNRAPFCTVSDNSTTQFSDVSATSTTVLTVTFAAAFTGTIYWNCGGAG